MLGVDHVGHRYYADHPEMKLKLRQVDRFIREIIAEMDQHTLLLVFGDHGMTDDGNHGGDSREEATSALFAHSKREFHYKSHQNPLGSGRKTLKQIDLVPSLSILLGVGIPFNNLGAVIPELFMQEAAGAAIYTNALQVSKYLRTYDSEVKKLPDTQYENLLYKFETLEKEYLNGRGDLKGLHDYIIEAGDMCRGIWTTFDLGLMFSGGSVLVSVLLALLIMGTQELQFEHLLRVIVVCMGVSLLSPTMASCL